MADVQEQTQPLAQTAPSQSIARVPTRLGIVPTTVEEGWRLAQMMSRSELVPKNFRNKPDDIIVAIQMGVEIGLPPMQALQSIGVINGRPSVYGDGFLAIIMASAAYADHDEYYEVEGKRVDGLVADDFKKDSTAAVCTFVRRGKLTPVTRRFTVGQARKASLLGKEGPWTSYPDRMLSMRARSWAGRDAFPDVLRGISPAEEAQDAAPEMDVPPLPEVRRISETAAAPAVEPIKVSAPPVIVLDAATVKDVEQFLGGYTVTLGNGLKVDLTEEADAVELEKFVGTPNKVRMTVDRVDKTLQLKSFVIAD